MGGNGSYFIPGKVFDFYFLDHGLDLGVFRLHDGITRYNVLLKDASAADMLPVCREKSTGVTGYVVDLCDAEFVDSSAFGTIIDVMEEAIRHNVPETQIVVHNDDAAEIMELLDFGYSKTQKNTIPGLPRDYTGI